MAKEFFGKIFPVAAIAVVIAVAGPECRAEDLPRSGGFEGIYRQDRWGVGRFNYFLVSPESHEQLKPYANKRIHLEVLMASQLANPGDAMILKVGQITELENSQVIPEMKFRATDRSQSNGRRGVELTFFLKNQSDKPVELSLQDVYPEVRM